MCASSCVFFTVSLFIEAAASPTHSLCLDSHNAIFTKTKISITMRVWVRVCVAQYIHHFSNTPKHMDDGWYILIHSKISENLEYYNRSHARIPITQWSRLNVLTQNHTAHAVVSAKNVKVAAVFTNWNSKREIFRWICLCICGCCRLANLQMFSRSLTYTYGRRTQTKFLLFILYNFFFRPAQAFIASDLYRFA